MVLVLWYSLLCVSTPLSLKATPTHASIGNDLRVPEEFISISKDSSKTKKYDTTNKQKPAVFILNVAKGNPSIARWQKLKKSYGQCIGTSVTLALAGADLPNFVQNNLDNLNSLVKSTDSKLYNFIKSE